ncbi:MAG: ACT domain-containing protein [Eubacteriales bacterium]|jgi:chorismate mutase|nr:ACT domain-containing protein [Eubacteriales bacterium]MDD4327203.1 ACT domain-containing protein [Eubacteriales bacterium]NCU25886.1 ACT domain-containing protein [Candidatus Nomurabacteria bacterium]
MKTEYYLIKSDILPEVFTKVMEVKRLLGLGKATSVNQAVKMVDLSRSAYYKYKDSILPFYETSRGKLVTVIFMVEDFPGILSGIVNALADANANILTINQNIPINGLADVSIVIETDKLNTELEYLLTDIERIPGVRSYKILARE